MRFELLVLFSLCLTALAWQNAIDEEEPVNVKLAKRQWGRWGNGGSWGGGGGSNYNNNNGGGGWGGSNFNNNNGGGGWGSNFNNNNGGGGWGNNFNNNNGRRRRDLVRQRRWADQNSEVWNNDI